MKLYTGKGDKGMTSLAGGRRVPKTHLRLEAYGTIDELNSFIGLLMTEIEDCSVQELMLFIQSKLFCIGSFLATDPKDYQMESRIADETIKRIEEAIDKMDNLLPRLRSFVLPGGVRSAAVAHVCRTVCRRAERMIYRVAETDKIESSVLIFINRLSDLLFVIARKECLEKKEKEFFWDNSCK